jgi:hypothetical protein
LENNFTFADGYTVNVNYTGDLGTEAETTEEEDAKTVEKTLSVKINKKSGDSNIAKE